MNDGRVRGSMRRRCAGRASRALLLLLACLVPAAHGAGGLRVATTGHEALAGIDALTDGALQSGVFSGAVVLVATDGAVVKHRAYGRSARTGDAMDDRTRERARDLDEGAIFDLASLTKIVTAVCVLQLADRGLVALDAPVRAYLPEFPHDGVSVLHLLRHEGGLPAWAPLYSRHENPAERLAALFGMPLARPAGGERLYSDLGYMLLGLVVERASGLTLDAYVARHVAEPLGLEHLRFNPPPEWLERVVATEAQPWTGRALVWGEAHDENAWAFGGVGGHAGLFGSARDVAVFAQALLDDAAERHGEAGARLLEANTARALLDARTGVAWARGSFLGAFEARPGALGHTGFTGTSLVVDPPSRTVLVVLTNRVHPSRDGPSVGPYRSAVASLVHDSLPALAGPR